MTTQGQKSINLEVIKKIIAYCHGLEDFPLFIVDAHLNVSTQQ